MLQIITQDLSIFGHFPVPKFGKVLPIGDCLAT